MGRVTEVRLRLDGRGAGSPWKLARVSVGRVKPGTHEVDGGSLHLPVHRWLDVGEHEL